MNIFTELKSIEEADDMGHFIMSKGYEGIQNDSYRYCRESIEWHYEKNIRHGKKCVFVGANCDMMVVGSNKRGMRRVGLKFIEKPRVFMKLLEETDYLKKVREHNRRHNKK